MKTATLAARRPNAGAAFDAASAHLRSVRDVLRFAVTRFSEAQLCFGHGSDNALDEAAYLICHALSLPLDKFDLFLDAVLLPEEIDGVLAFLRPRVIERVPAAYLTREAWLGEYRFHVDERVIVPRSYIAHWLMDDPSPWIEDPASIRSALDLCTGSGCLAIVMAHVLPNARIAATDLSAEALSVARVNVVQHGLEDRIRLHRSDLFQALKPADRYSLIVTNPPYVTARSMADLPAEYRHEPSLALAGGDDGLDLVRRILAQAQDRLRPGGLIVVEVGHARETVEAAFPRTAFTWLEIDGVDDAVFVLTREQLPPARMASA